MENNKKEDTEYSKTLRDSERRRFREALVQHAMAEEQKIRKSRASTLLVVLNVALTVLIITMIRQENGKFIEKKEAQKDISSIISNGGDLRAIKQALENQPKTSTLNLMLSSKEAYYPKGIALSYVLEDIRLEAFRANSTELLPKLDLIMQEHDEVNPFDKLQVGQKDYFENLRIKTGSDYTKISNDVNKLADELHQKNLLVDEYLSDSKMSFWISIFAVFLSLAIGGYQIFTGRPEALKKLLLSLSTELNGESEGERNSNKKNLVDN